PSAFSSLLRSCAKAVGAARSTATVTNRYMIFLRMMGSVNSRIRSVAMPAALGGHVLGLPCPPKAVGMAHGGLLEFPQCPRGGVADGALAGKPLIARSRQYAANVQADNRTDRFEGDHRRQRREHGRATVGVIRQVFDD